MGIKDKNDNCPIPTYSALYVVRVNPNLAFNYDYTTL